MANYELSNLKYKGNTYTIKDNSALHQDSIGSWMPDFANLKPISTHEFNIASTSYYKICERPNVTAIKDIADEVLAFRITVTGTNIFAIADVLVRLQPTVNVRPLVTVNYQTQSTSAATTGIRYLRTVNPKSVNTSYKYEIAIAAYNSTSRHIKVEIFKAPSTWTFASAATVYSYNSTYQTASDLTLYTSIGAFYNYTWYGTASYANYAGYKSVWDALFCNGPGNFIKAGAAIAANQFVFIGKDNKFYPTTSTSVEIDPAWPIAYCTTAHAANADVQWSAIRTWGHVSPASSILKDGTLVAKDTVYMRCTYTNGKLYSANTMTQNLTAGNTYIKLGKMSSATAVVVNTYNSEYFTLDTYGSLTALKALNGYLIEAAKADTASTVSKGGSTAAGTYGVLFDNYPITSVVPTNTSPRVNSNLTFDPSTGNLTSGIFTGSGAGLTGIPSSGVDFGDIPDISEYTGPGLDSRFATFMQTETDGEYTDPYMMPKDALAYRLTNNSLYARNGICLNGSKIAVFSGGRLQSASADSMFACFMFRTIEINTTSYEPVNTAIVSGTKMSFKVQGIICNHDGTSAICDTYFTIMYNGSGVWSVAYTAYGDPQFKISLSPNHSNKGKLSIVVGFGASQTDFERCKSNYKPYRYAAFRCDYLGSSDSLSGSSTPTDNLSSYFENRSNWGGAYYNTNSSQTWSEFKSAVYEYQYIEGIDQTAPKTDTDVFLSRTATNGDKKYKSAKLVGGTVAFNQIAVAPSNRTAYGITVTRDSEKKTTTVSGTATRVLYVQFDESPLPIVGHVYYASLGNASIPNNTIILYNDNAGVNTGYGQNGETIGKATGAKKFHYRIDATASFSSPVTLTPQIIDLTLMFGKTIADRIYALETATTGAGVAWFKKYFPKDYYPYNTGTLVSVCPTGMVSGDASYKVSPLELNGYPSIDSNDNLVYDGDIRESNGTVTRKYRKVNIEAFTGAWGATDNGYAVYYADYDLTRSANSICDRFTAVSNPYTTMPVMTWRGSSGESERFTFILPSTVTSLAEANAWLASNPTTIIAELTRGLTESTYPFKSPQLVYSGETESFIDDRNVPMPVGQIAEYMESLDAVEDAVLVDTGSFELLSNKTTTIDSSSTDDQYPSAKAVYDNTPAVYYGTCSTAAATTTKVIDGVPTNAKIQEGTMLHVSFYPITKIPYAYNVTLSINGTNYIVRTYTDYQYGYDGSSSYCGASLNDRTDVDFVFKTRNNVLYAMALDIKAVVLKNMWTSTSRNANLNNMTYPIDGLFYTLATSSITAANGKPYFNGELRDSYVLAMNWDNTRAYGAQLAIANGGTTAQGGIAYRRQKGLGNVTAAGWYDWKTVLDEDNVSKYVSEKTDATFAYTASGLAFSSNALTIPIDGTKYKILQMTVFNKDLSFGLGFPRLFIFDAAGSVGYIEGTSTYCTTTSAASGITASFDSSWEVSTSTNVDIVVLYRRIS